MSGTSTQKRRASSTRGDDIRAPRKGVSRRQLLAGAAGIAAAASVGAIAQAQEEPPDPTTVVGASTDELGERAQDEMLTRMPFGGRPHGTLASLTPIGELLGTITPSDLHYEVTHHGIPDIDVSTFKLLIHGMVDRPTVFTLDDLKRFPRTQGIHFMECSGNGLFHLLGPAETDTAQRVSGLASCTEWVGVPVATVMKEVGVQSSATWALFEGMDGSTTSRSIPTEELWWGGGILAYGQNGEALRPANGYPLRLVLPGTEGNINIKWLRRIEFSDRPFETRYETSTYSDVRPNDEGDLVATQFTLRLDAKSIITYPSGGHAIAGPGWHEINGLAWSGRGPIESVEVSTDGGRTFHAARLEQPVLDKAFTRFRYLWDWDGEETVIVSRAIDSTGYVQPTRDEMLAQHGSTSTFYHNNAQARWRVNVDGTITSGDVAQDS